MDYSKLIGIVPDHVYLQLKEFGPGFGLNTNNRLAHFLANCKHESANYTKVEENLNYTAKRLAQVFPTRFSVNPKAKEKEPNKLALQIQNRPALIGAYAYGGKLGNAVFTGFNGAEQSDGYRFRGAGYLGLTGKNNFRAFGNSIGVDLVKNPEEVKEKYPCTSALFFFHENGLFLYSDTHSIAEVRGKINSGLLGLEKVKTYYSEYMSLLEA